MSVETSVHAPATTPAHRATGLVRRLRGMGAVVLLVAMLAFGLVAVPHFATASNLVDIVQSQALVGIVAVGMTFVVISGNFVDLSVPATMAITAAIALGLYDRLGAAAIPLAFAAACTIGSVNGFLVAVANVNPVIATLGVRTICGGVLYGVTNGAFQSTSNQGFVRFGAATPLGVPVAAIAFVALLALGQIVLTKTTFGTYARFVGANARAARANGIAVAQIGFTCFVISAAMAAVAAIFLSALENQADLTTGQGYEFDALAAVVIGGVSLAGGIGNCWRTLIGVLVIGVANNVMLLEGFDTSEQLFAKGVILVLAVSLDALAARGDSR